LDFIFCTLQNESGYSLWGRMEQKKYVAYNQTRDSLLSSSVTTVNAGLEPLKVLKVLIEGLPANSRTGLWLTNFKGVPVARTLSPFDLVYLDKDNRVVQGMELSKDGEFAPPRGQPASALVLPPKSMTASQTRAGDQIELRIAEPEAQPANVPAAAAVPSSPSDLASSQQSEPRPAELSPSARFFSPGGIALPAHTAVPASEQLSAQSSVIESRATESKASPVEQPPARTDRTPGIENAGAPKIETSPEQFVRTRETAPFWPERKMREHFEAPSAVVAVPDAATPVEPQQDMAAASVSPSPIPEPPATTPRGGAYGPVVTPRYSWKVRLLRWLFPELVIREAPRPVDRRRADRQALPGLAAYYFTGGSPEPQRIGNISVTGFYLHTDERWMPGTVVRMTLQRIGSKGDDPSDTITVNSKIVRWGSDGEGFEFILTDLDE
jgi:hypothetical protein